MNQTIFYHFKKRADSQPNAISIQYKDNGVWRYYTWSQLYEMTAALAVALKNLSLSDQSRVAILSETRPEWMISDLAIMGAGYVTVPIYPSSLPEELEHILNHSESEVLILENLEQFEKFKKIKNKCKSVQHVFIFDSSSLKKNEDALLWINLIKVGHTFKAEFEKLASALTLESWATLIYTSGTTGKSKGAVLTHEQIMSELADVFAIVNVDESDSSLAFLPFSHVLGRVEAWGSIYAGYTINFAESIERLRDNFSEVRPTFLISVPRVFEKLYSAILTQAQNNPLKKKAFDWALKVGKQYSFALQNKNFIGPLQAAEYAVAKKVVFDQIMKGLGGRLRLAACGGAPLSKNVAEFFHAIGLLILEGYGLTETTAAVTFNSPLEYSFGTVGKPLADVQIQFASDGEILVRSKKCFKEYYKNPDANKEVFENGFFKTGDIGTFDENGFLKITDRKKDLIKTAGGKYVAPQRLEGLLKKSPYISNVLIHGDLKKYIVALITLNEGAIKKWAADNGLPSQSYEDLTQSPEVMSLIRDVVAEANSELASFESIKKFSILKSDFSVQTGELTPSLKVKRKVADQKYAGELAALYGEG